MDYQHITKQHGKDSLLRLLLILVFIEDSSNKNRTQKTYIWCVVKIFRSKNTKRWATEWPLSNHPIFFT